MTNAENGLWPDNWREGRDVAQDRINALKARVRTAPLEQADLAQLTETLGQLVEGYGRSESNTVIRSGMDVIRLHFAQRFRIKEPLKPYALYNRILDNVLPTGYFEGSSPENPELKALSILTAYELNKRQSPEKEAEMNRLVVEVVTAAISPNLQRPGNT